MLELPRGAIFANSEVGRNSKARLSLQEFNEQMQSYLSSITESCLSLRLACVSFGTEDRTILPVQCRKALQSLQEIDEPLQEFSKLLREVERLPVIITALRYRPLSILNLMDKQISRLQDLVNDYGAVCISPSQHEKRLRKETYQSLKVFLPYISALSEQVKLLNDEAEEQEGRLLSFLEE